MRILTISLCMVGVLLLATGTPVLAGDEATTMDVHLKDTPVAQALKQVAEAAGINIVVTPDAKERHVSLQLRDVPWKTALHAIASAAGLQVKHTQGNVYVVTVNQGALKPVDDTGWKTLGIRQELERKLAETRARIGDLEARLAAARRANAAADESKAKRKTDTVLLGKLTGRVLDAKGKPVKGVRVQVPRTPGQQVTYVQLYDVRDLDLDAGGVTPILERLRKEGARIEQKGDHGVLVVSGSEQAQTRIRMALEDARRKRGMGPKVLERGITLPGRQGPARFVVERKGAATAPKTVTRSVGMEGRVIATFVGGDEKALGDRADQLAQAAKLLDAAGAREEAARVREQAKQARVAYRAAVERRRLAAKAVHMQRADLGARIDALRTDVAALRKEVGDLTSLVRELVERRRR